MSNKKSTKQSFLEFLVSNGGKPEDQTWERIASRFGLKSGETARHIWRNYRSLNNEQRESASYIGELEDRITRYEENLQSGDAELQYNSSQEIKTLEELIQKTNIDLEKWEITRWVQNFWNNKYQVKAFLSPKTKKEEDIQKDFISFIEKYESTYKPKSYNKSAARKVDVEISIADFHLDKKTITRETIEDREEEYKETIDILLYQTSKAYDIGQLVLVVGNDFFHTDNYQGSTTSLTPQDTLSTWSEAYEIGFDILVNTIQKSLDVADNVSVILVLGNHDKTKSYYLTHALEAYFRKEKRVSFDRENSNVKHVCLGNTFIGYHHGNCKIDELPLIFATSELSSKDFGLSRYREIHTGDKHFYMAKEVKGVRIQQMPSLSGTDKWHSDNNYINSIRAGLALVYDRVKGKIAEFEHRL